MRSQSGYGGFPAILLTFSLLLLVLAVGFVVGRVVVARAYLDKAPKFDVQAASAPEMPSELGRERSAVPGRVYVPPPAPPPTAPDEVEGIQADARGEAPEAMSESAPAPAEAAPADAGEPRRTTEPRVASPARGSEPRSGGEARERGPAAQPRETAPEQDVAEARTYSIQVGVFTSRPGARQVVESLARAGYPASISPEKSGSQELYRVVTGRYRSEYAARKAVEELRKEGFEGFLVQQ